MKVYVAVRGCYSQQYVSGVFDSAERAMAAESPDDQWIKWNENGYIHWENTRDWDEDVRIEEFEFVSDGPVKDAYASMVRDDPDGRTVRYMTE